MADLSGLTTNYFATPKEGFTTTSASSVASGAVTVPLNSVTGYTNGAIATFVIEPTSSTAKQAFTGVVDTAGVQLTSVVWTEGTNQTHNAGSTVVDYTTATHFAAAVKGILIEHSQAGLHTAPLITSRTEDTAPDIGADFLLSYDTSAAALKKVKPTNMGLTTGYVSGQLPAVSSVAANGNRSYNMTFASTVAALLTPGMRLRITPTVAPPTQCTSLNGTTQYYSKSSPAGMAFTDDFVVSAWVKLASYNAAINVIASRYNGTSGWRLTVNSDGTIHLDGFNAAAANFSSVASYQSLPLNKWVHVAAQLDMSAFTATTVTSYVMLDGVDVPSIVSRGGTNPTALIQAGNLEIGGNNGGLLPFNGKLSQVAIYNAKVTQATVLASMNQTLSGSETSEVSAYSFNNSINDLNANANNLTANGAAVATNADSPFAVDANGVPGIYDWAIVTKVATTVATVQVPEANTIPTTGGVSAVDLSTQKAPFGMPVQLDKWQIKTVKKTSESIATGVSGVYTASNHTLSLPIGSWNLIKSGLVSQNNTIAGNIQYSSRLNGASFGPVYDSYDYRFFGNTTSTGDVCPVYSKSYLSITAAEVFTHQIAAFAGAGTTTAILRGDLADTFIIAECAYL